jgi:site-specific recombinase XerD
MDQPDPQYTIRAAIDGFLLDRRVRGCSANTLRCYRDELHQLELYTGAYDMFNLSADVLRGFYASLESKRNRGGVHSVYRVVHAFLNWFYAEMDGDYKLPKLQISPPKHHPLPGVSLEDIQKMLNNLAGANKVRDHALLLALLDTGARGFEFVALNLGDVDMITGATKIQRGKGDKERTVYMGSNTRRAVRRYIKTRTRLNQAAPMWLTVDGDRLTKRGLREVVEAAAKRAGVDAPGLHDFRRAFAVNMWRNGADLLTISRLLGHADLSTTRRYIADQDDDLRAGHARSSPVDCGGL